MSEPNITTVYLFRQFARITESGDIDKLLERLLDQTCVAIATACRRTFGVATYRQWLDGNGSDFLLLDNWPILNLYRVVTSTQNAGTVQYAGSGMHADISITDAQCELHWMDAAGTEQDKALTFEANATVQALVTAINAVTDWTATVNSGFETQPSVFLRPLSGEWVKSPDTVDLVTPDEAAAVRIADDGLRRIERMDGGRFPRGVQSVLAWYKAGYTLMQDDETHSRMLVEGTVPKDLTLLANQIMQQVYHGSKKDPSLKSETIADYKWAESDIFSAIEKHWPELSQFAAKDI